MNNIKLNKYKCELLDFQRNVIKMEYILANCHSDAIVIFVDKYKKVIDKMGYDIRTTMIL